MGNLRALDYGHRSVVDAESCPEESVEDEWRSILDTALSRPIEVPREHPSWRALSF